MVKNRNIPGEKGRGLFSNLLSNPSPKLLKEMKKMFYKAVGARCNVPLLILFMLQGCATIPGTLTGDLVRHERNFPAAYDGVWTATMDALEGIHIKEANKEKGRIVTEWTEKPPIQKGTGLIIDTYWIERYRFSISITRESEKNTRLNVLCLVQEKTKGGTRSLRWVQKKSSGEREQQLLDKIEKILASQ